MELKDLTNALKGYLYEKRKSPFYVAFIVTWIAYNWKALVFLFSDSSIEMINKIQLVEKNYIKPIYFSIDEKGFLIGWENIYFPIGIALIVFVLGNSLTLGFRRLKLVFEYIQKKYIDEHDVMTKQENEIAQNKLREYENRINLQGSDLNRRNEGLASELKKVSSEFNDYKKENNNGKKYIEDINNQILIVEKERDELIGGVAQYKTSHELNVSAIKKLEEENMKQKEEIEIMKNEFILTKNVNVGVVDDTQKNDNEIEELMPENILFNEYNGLKNSDFFNTFIALMESLSYTENGIIGERALSNRINKSKFKDGNLLLNQVLQDVERMDLLYHNKKYNTSTLNNRGKQLCDVFVNQDAKTFDFSEMQIIKLKELSNIE